MVAQKIDRSGAGAAVLTRSRVMAGSRILSAPYKRHFGMIRSGIPAGGMLLTVNPMGGEARGRRLSSRGAANTGLFRSPGQPSALASRGSRSATVARLAPNPAVSPADGNVRHSALERRLSSVSPLPGQGDHATFEPPHRVRDARRQAVASRLQNIPGAMTSALPSARRDNSGRSASLPIHAPAIQPPSAPRWSTRSGPIAPPAPAAAGVNQPMQRFTARVQGMLAITGRSGRSPGSFGPPLRSVAPTPDRMNPPGRDIDDVAHERGADASGAEEENNAMEGDLYLDGHALGRWFARHLGRMANGPAMGVNAVDVRSIAMWPGSTF